MSTDGQPSDPRTSLPGAIEAVAALGDLDAMLAGVLAAGATALRPDMGAIFISDPDRPGLQLAVAHGLDELSTAPAGRARSPIRPTRSPSPRSSRVATFDREASMPDGSSFVGAYLPLLVSSRGLDVALGSIGFGWPAARTLDAAERETLTALAALAAVAVDRDRLASTAAERSEWFERMAHTDPLTGLANARTVGRILELELARAGRQGSEVSFAMFDVDDFQATNRESGNEAGDDVLRRVAAVLAESVRLVDTVGRIGGDEFVLVAPGSAGLTVARRVLDGIAALPPVGGTADHDLGRRGPLPGRRRRRRRADRGGQGRPGARPGRRSWLGGHGDLVRRLTSDGRAWRSAPTVGCRLRPAARGLPLRTSAGAAGHALRDDRHRRRRGAGARLPREREDERTGRWQARALEDRRPGVAHGEAAERDGRGVTGDHPGLVDLAARRRRERLHGDRDLARGADRREPRAGAAVRRQDRGERAGLGSHLEDRRDTILVRARGVELDAEEEAQPAEGDDRDDRGDPEDPGAGRRPAGATRIALIRRGERDDAGGRAAAGSRAPGGGPDGGRTAAAVPRSGRWPTVTRRHRPRPP